MPEQRKKAQKPTASSAPAASLPSASPSANPASPKNPDAFEPVLQAGRDTWRFLRSLALPYLGFLLKIQLLGMAIILIGLAFLLAVLIVIISPPSFSPLVLVKYLAQLPPGTWAAVAVVAALGVLILQFIGYAFEAAKYAGTREIIEGRPAPPILATARSKLAPVSMYALAALAITALPFLPSLLLFFGAFSAAGSGNGATLGLVGGVLLIPAFITLLLAWFLIQFSFFGLALANQGVLESLRASYRLVRRNLLGVFVFDITLIALLFFIGILFMAVEYAFSLFSFFLTLLNPLLGSGFSLAITIALNITQSVLAEAVLLPFAYRYWKSISEIKP